MVWHGGQWSGHLRHVRSNCQHTQRRHSSRFYNYNSTNDDAGDSDADSDDDDDDDNDDDSGGSRGANPAMAPHGSWQWSLAPSSGAERAMVAL